MARQARQICTITADPRLAEHWRRAIEPFGGSHTAFDGLMTALRRLADRSPDIILLDLANAGLTVEQLTAKVRHRAPMADLLLVEDAEPGGWSKPATWRDLSARWGANLLPRDQEIAQLRARLTALWSERDQVARCGWVGLSPEIRAASNLLLAAAQSDATVLIEGESGTGKELAARAVHRNSARAAKPFLALNCSAFPETLLESELFGHEKGAFTDAFGRKKGIFEAVDGGTIFLDEIGETSPAVQARLLRVLEERQVRPIGATRALPVDFRIVAATNRHLQSAVADGHFRRDLYFRLAVVQLPLAPLRDRRADVPALLAHHRGQAGGALTGFLDEPALARLVDYDWPGNIRELRNFVERAGVRFPGLTLDTERVGELLENVRPGVNLPVATGRRAENVEREMIFAALSELKRDLDYLKRRVDRLSDTDHAVSGGDRFASMREVERERIALALQQTRGNRSQAARLLGIGERTLYRKIREYGL
ncbi:MAG TPA: sigma-54 dependent transcriptional regulator [bacterium]|nr:sigma-54 dependent transcriptional regulator [bacterium]